MPYYLIYISAIILGILNAVSFAPTPSGILQITAITGLLALLRIAKRPARVMWVFGVAWFTAGLYWLHFSMHDVGGLPFVASAALVVVLAICLAAFYALGVHFWSRWRVGARSEVWALCVVFPLVWLAAELARGYLFFSGFPWLASGYAQIDNPLLKGWFAVLGVYGVGMWMAFLSGALLTLILFVCKKITLSAKTFAVLSVSTAALLVTGLILQGVKWGNNVGSPIVVRMVQPNIPQNLKFDRDEIIKNSAIFLDQAASSAAPLTVFPETVLPYSWLDLSEDALKPLQASLTNQRAVLIGSVGETGRDTDQAAYYNSAMWLDSNVDMRNPPRYDKNHLLPMGETIPYGFKWLIDMMQIPLGGYKAGDGYTPFVLNTAGGAIKVSANICYENEFGEDLIKAWKNGDDNAPNVWVNMTNLGWFGTHDVSTNQAQHLQMSRARAMEMARPMLVVTNTGTSANIDAMGDVLDQLPADQAVVQDVTVQPRRGLTPYIALGNLPVLALLSIAFGLMILSRHRHMDI